jgi:hypothetical protein
MYPIFPVGISGALEGGDKYKRAPASERMNVYDSRGPEVHLGVTRVSARATILKRCFEILHVFKNPMPNDYSTLGTGMLRVGDCRVTAEILSKFAQDYEMYRPVRYM